MTPPDFFLPHLPTIPIRFHSYEEQVLMGFIGQNVTGDDGVPDGGHVSGTGIEIAWQKGPLLLPSGRLSSNGALVEDVVRAALMRLEYYQKGPHASEHNAEAIALLERAIECIDRGTSEREAPKPTSVRAA